MGKPRPSQARTGGPSFVSPAPSSVGNRPVTEPESDRGQWAQLRKRILDDQRQHPPSDVFGTAVKKGAVYLWGFGTSAGAAPGPDTQWISRLASGVRVDGKRFRCLEPETLLLPLEERLTAGLCDAEDAATATTWAAALPALSKHLCEFDWWAVLGSLHDFREGLLRRQPGDPLSLIGVAELSMTLAWRLRSVPSCRRLWEGGESALEAWTRTWEQTYRAVLAQPRHLRLVLASLIRVRSFYCDARNQVAPTKGSGGKRIRRVREAIDECAIELATWAAAMTRSDGCQAFAPRCGPAVRADVGRHGLLLSAAALDPDSVLPAMRAALGDAPSAGRLAWQIGLPDSMLHDGDAGVACLMPQWDVRRGKLVASYGQGPMRIELSSGKCPVISGDCECSIRVDGSAIEPVDDWVATCEYSDDDVHYLELEQVHEEGFVLQRQLMLLREDCCCLLADAVVEGGLRWGFRSARGNGSAWGNGSAGHKIEHRLRLPLGETVTPRREPETNEWFLADDKKRALLISLASGEWRSASPHRNGQVRCDLTDDHHLLVTSSGRGRLFVPLWIDLSRKRFNRSRTWRRLTVAQQRQVVPADEAAAFRIQVGRSQWLLYRSLIRSLPRTFFGKQVTADFYCARFDAGEQIYEDLISVDEGNQ